MIWTAACGSCCRRFILKPSTLTSCAPLSANICKYHKQDKTVAGLVQELKKLSTEVASDKDLANVASVSGEGRRAADHNPCALRRCAACIRQPFSSSVSCGGGGALASTFAVFFMLCWTKTTC